VVLGSNSDIGGRGGGSRGNGGRCEPKDSNPEPSDFEVEEEEKEDEEDEEMADPNLEWMTQGPLALPTILHKMSKQVKRMNIKFNPDSVVKS